ncbi:Got1/Sft2-like family-domain-containing protein [Neohortaea acidophila]|uniref:Got1/Sft2-like family-domain-containing protein n=1 Tax=Neohortaea acidophila TaxID=245834 RepID=A0A6A6Q6J1_9PEZI|nr:Got1/Sft2-like family-domain-containing protein [Neohortaea acidophila]KAF2487902.1 Got1/Sft2-like family-domain-containing protein [Neohortaea acidophila]
MPTLWLSDSQKIGVAFCSGGALFLLLGLIFLFDRALLAMGNILFLIGITLLLGPQRTFLFFARKQKWRGSAAFWAGVLLILIRWTFVGILVEAVGIFYLFGEFFKTLAGFAYGIPIIGPYLARGLQVAGDKAGASERAHKDLPV